MHANTLVWGWAHQDPRSSSLCARARMSSPIAISAAHLCIIPQRPVTFFVCYYQLINYGFKANICNLYYMSDVKMNYK